MLPFTRARAFFCSEGDADTVNFPTLLAADDGSVLTVILLKCHTCDSVGGVKSTWSGLSGDVIMFSHNFRCGSAVLWSGSGLQADFRLTPDFFYNFINFFLVVGRLVFKLKGAPLKKASALLQMWWGSFVHPVSTVNFNPVLILLSNHFKNMRPKRT